MSRHTEDQHHGVNQVIVAQPRGLRDPRGLRRDRYDGIMTFGESL